jgi:hypothetical protein
VWLVGGPDEGGHPGFGRARRDWIRLTGGPPGATQPRVRDACP